MKIELNKLTDLEKAFVTAGVKEYNDLMFGNDLNHGIPKASLGGVMSSLSKKGIIEIDWTFNDTAFQFIGDNGEADYENPPTLV